MTLGVDSSGDNLRNVLWPAVKAGGYSFAFIRATDGTWIDPTCTREWPRLKAAGLIRGAYMFLRYSSPAEKQVAAFIAQVPDLGPGDFPPVLDVEFPGKGRAVTGPTVEQCLSQIRQAVELLTQHYGCAPILYTSARVFRDDLGSPQTPDLVSCPLWLARYIPTQEPPCPPSWAPGSWWFHQYSGDVRGVAGFVGRADLNRFNVYADPKDPRTAWVKARCGGRTVAEYQAAHGLVADGAVGPVTFSHLAWERV